MTDTLLNLADVPPTPRIDDYFGLWAVEGMRFMAAFDRVRNMDLVQHVRTSERPALKSRMMFTTVSREETLKSAGYKDTGGYGYAEAQIVGGGGMKLAVISLSGVIMKQVGSLEDGTSSVLVRRDIRHAAADDSIGGIMILIDSPGGTVSGTSDLAAEITAAAAKKPCYAMVEDLCASAAYWAASACTKIFANAPTALIGSIGTYACLYDYSAAAAMQGIKAYLFTTGKIKGVGVEGTEITAEQREYFQGIVEQTQGYFEAAVAKNRKMSAEKVKGLATGAVYLAQNAVANGLIDGMKTFDEAVSMLAGASAKAREDRIRRMNADLVDLHADEKSAEEDKKKKKDGEGDSTSAESTMGGKTDEANDSTAAALAVAGETPLQEDAMSVPKTEAQNGPKAASLQELKAALPKANAEFLVKAIEDGLCVEAAKDRHIQAQDAQIEDFRAKSKEIGTRPVGGGGGNQKSDAGDFNELVAAKMRENPNLERRNAVKLAAKENPEAHQAFIAGCPKASKRPAGRQA